MEIADIRREKVIGAVSTGEVGTSTAELAASVLGYNARRARVEEETELPRLRSVLAKLDIEILNEIDVARYKMEKRHAAESRQLSLEPRREAVLYWNERNIKEYRKSIPEFVLNKAVQIKRECPECEVLIDELSTTPDPFLIVKIGYQEEYYIEVWGEPGFEGRSI